MSKKLFARLGTILFFAMIGFLPGCLPPPANSVPPTALFNVSVPYPVPGDAIQFTDESLNGTVSVTSWLWDFGDGPDAISQEQNPIHAYNAAGIYTATLSVTTSAGSDTASREIVVYNTIGRTALGGPMGSPGELRIFTQTMCEGIAGAEVKYNKEANKVILEGDFVGLPFRPTISFPDTEVLADRYPFNEFQETIENGRWQFWFVGRILLDQSSFYYDTDTLDLIGNEFDLDEVPLGATEVLFPVIQAVCTDFFESDPDDLTANVAFEFDYDRILDSLGTAGSHFALVPRNFSRPDDVIGYFTSGGLPLSEAMDFDDILEALNAGNRIFASITYEPFPKPAFLAARDNFMVGWGGTMPSSAAAVYPDPCETSQLDAASGVPELVLMSAGWFERGARADESQMLPNEGPRHQAIINEHFLGKYQVTNNEHAAMLNFALDQGRLTDETGGPYDGLDVYTEGRLALELTSFFCQIRFSGGRFIVGSRDGLSMRRHPATMVTWYGAAAFANWLSEFEGLETVYDTGSWERKDGQPNGFRLPTGAEWERAGAWDETLELVALPDGSTGGHWIYGYQSDAYDGARANLNNGNPLGLFDQPFTTPVGYYDGVSAGTADSPSPWGLYDMTGNLWDWCEDWYAPMYSFDAIQDNPRGPATGPTKVFRGGAWDTSLELSGGRTASRGEFPPGQADPGIGFRVAR